MGKNSKARRAAARRAAAAQRSADAQRIITPQAPQLPPGLSVGDSFSNPLARLGVGSPNLIDSSDYVKTVFTADYARMTALYRQNWVVRRVINTVPEDMLKNWYEFDTNLSPEARKQLRREEQKVQLKAKLLDGMRWGRLFGGALALMVIDGHEDILDEPLDLDMVMPGSFRGLMIFDRWSGVSPSGTLVDNINDPDFGLPDYYTLNSDTLGYSFRVHHSRVLRFTGRSLPRLEQIAEQFWGASELEHMMEALKKYDNTSYNIAMLVFGANLKVYKMENMEQIGAMNENAQRDLYNTLTAMNWMMNNQGMQVIGNKDDFQTHQYSFAGLPDVLDKFMLDVSGASGIPVTKLYGREPAGLNSTGESDMNNYYDSIEEQQESDLRPHIDKLLPVQCMSVFGRVPDDLEYHFVSCRRPSEEEKKNLAKNVAEAAVSVYNAGGINQRHLLTELKNTAPYTGMWASISDEDIANADTAFGPSGEDIPGGLPEGFMNKLLNPGEGHTNGGPEE